MKHLAFNEVTIGSFTTHPVRLEEDYFCCYCNKDVTFMFLHNETKLEFCSVRCAVDELNKRAYEKRNDL